MVQSYTASVLEALRAASSSPMWKNDCDGPSHVETTASTSLDCDGPRDIKTEGPTMNLPVRSCVSLTSTPVDGHDLSLIHI